MRCVAFVFARGGSKGILRKNLQEVGGRTLLERSIECGLACPSISAVYVSTDSDEIAEVALRAGAVVPELRPSRLAQDDSPELDSWKHAIAWLMDDHGDFGFDVFVSLPPTAPLRTPEIVERCITALDNTCDMVVTGSPAVRHPAFNMVMLDVDGYASLLQPSPTLVARRQEAPKVFDLSTVAYVTRPQHVMSMTSVLQGRVRLVEVDRRVAVDVDDDIDLILARALAEEAGDK